MQGMILLLKEKGLSEYIEENLETLTLYVTDREYRRLHVNEKKCKLMLVKLFADD